MYSTLWSLNSERFQKPVTWWPWAQLQLQKMSSHLCCSDTFKQKSNKSGTDLEIICQNYPLFVKNWLIIVIIFNESCWRIICFLKILYIVLCAMLTTVCLVGGLQQCVVIFLQFKTLLSFLGQIFNSSDLRRINLFLTCLDVRLKLARLDLI